MRRVGLEPTTFLLKRQALVLLSLRRVKRRGDGADESRTRYLTVDNRALFRLSYSPIVRAMLPDDTMPHPLGHRFEIWQGVRDSNPRLRG